MKNKLRGFTLIELLVVISLISLLAALVLAVGSSMSEKARITNTRGSIYAIAAACEQYKAVYYLYPHLDRAPNDSLTPIASFTAPVGGGATDANCQIFNRRLRFLLEARTYTVDEIRYGPFLQTKLPKNEGDYAVEQDDTYLDGWGEPLRVWWGRNHTTDHPVGPNYYNATVPNRFPPDIWSFGSNFTDNTNGTDIATSLDTTDSSNGDDIASWLIRSN